MEELCARNNTHISTSSSATASHLKCLQSNLACFLSSIVQMKCSHRLLFPCPRKSLRPLCSQSFFSPKVLNTHWQWDFSDHIFWWLLFLLILFYCWFTFLILCHFTLCSCVNSFTRWFSNFLLHYFFFSSC